VVTVRPTWSAHVDVRRGERGVSQQSQKKKKKEKKKKKRKSEGEAWSGGYQEESICIHWARSSSVAAWR
jgi:hypothetical protein